MIRMAGTSDSTVISRRSAALWWTARFLAGGEAHGKRASSSPAGVGAAATHRSERDEQHQRKRQQGGQCGRERPAGCLLVHRYRTWSANAATGVVNRCHGRRLPARGEPSQALGNDGTTWGFRERIGSRMAGSSIRVRSCIGPWPRRGRVPCPVPPPASGLDADEREASTWISRSREGWAWR